MSCNCFKLSFICILLCILIITHKVGPYQITHNKANTFDIIYSGYKRLLEESHETDIFQTHSGENTLTHAVDNKLDENYTKYDKTSSCTLNDDIHQEHNNQREQIERENENHNKRFPHKSHKKSHSKKMKKSCISMLLSCGFPFFPIYFLVYSIYKKKTKRKKKKMSIQINAMYQIKI
ncbi:Plasmodium exported protein (hyp10), unknown, putative [Plasmodium sp.]|nr:Plasmodium exported protein (hyp10), unknown, putative [Plasmodium sp.]